MILVVGATGQLGTAVVRRLAATRQPVRAFVRPTSAHGHLAGPNIEIAYGDLRDPAQVSAACAGVTAVIATANAVIRRRGDTFASVDGEGYQNLIAACRQQGIKQFIYPSVPVTPIDAHVQALAAKRQTERRLQDSGLNYTIVRASVFMDVWLALIGSSTVTRGAEAPTVERPFWFSRAFMRAVGGLAERRGLALVPGSGQTRHAFIAVEDVAKFLVGCIGHREAEDAIFHLGGPEVLSWDEAVGLVGAAIGRKVRPIHMPAGLARAQRYLLRPLGEGPSNIMGMNWMVGSVDSAYAASEAARIISEPLLTMRQFLDMKCELGMQAAMTTRHTSR
jgi:uncharacterized protein YbjT (DUF2867 family)